MVFGGLVSYADIGHEKGNIFSKEVSNLSVPTGLSLIKLINHKYMLEMCQALSDQRRSQSKDRHIERI